MKPQIDFADFAKAEIRVGKIIESFVPEGSEKLIQFRVDFGPEVGEKTIFSGIKEWFDPTELVGIKTTWVVNLAPKKTPFGESEGMLFACDEREGRPHILKLGDEVEIGAEFH